MESALYGVYTLVVLYQKSHSFASISDTPQLVCKHRTHALSMKYSIYITKHTSLLYDTIGRKAERGKWEIFVATVF